MIGNAWRLGRLWGIELRLDPSWLIIFALVTWFLATHDFPMGHAGWLAPTYWGVAVLTTLLFAASVLAHEVAHSAVARSRGLPVRDITLFALGGVARVSQEPRRARDQAFTALAGPAASLALGVGFGLLWWLSRAGGGPLHAVAGWLTQLNVVLAVFNLLPGFPLDGGHVLGAVVWGITGNRPRAALLAARLGETLAVGFILWGLWEALAGSWVAGLWLAAIGWFLGRAATSRRQAIVLQRLLTGHTVREVMLRDCPRVPRRLSLDVLVERVIKPSGRRCFPVVDDGRLGGLVTLSQVAAVSRGRWTSTRVEDVMTSRQDLETVGPDDALGAVFDRMTAADIDQFPVVEQGQVVGVVARDAVLAVTGARTGSGFAR